MKQMYKTGYCKLEKQMREFFSSVGPEGFWICTSCRFKCSKLQTELPRIEPKQYY